MRAAPTLSRAVLLRWLQRKSREAGGQESFDYLQTTQQLGLLLHDKGDLAAAEPLLRDTAEGMTALRGDDDESALTSRAAYASLLLAKGDLAAAEPRLKEVCHTARLALGEGHVATQHCERQHIDCLGRLGIADAAAYVC